MPRKKAPPPLPTGPLVFNGEPLVPNDHVFVSPPWAERDGEPYLIARVLEVLQPQPLPSASKNPPDVDDPTRTSRALSRPTRHATGSASTSSTSRQASPNPSVASSSTSNVRPGGGSSRTLNEVTDLRVRVAYYFRTRDITNRYVADHRLIVATMHSDTVPARYVRGKCLVMHKEHVDDLETYKRRVDTFYWCQLYDRYLHRYFDALPTYKIRNAPPEVVKHLVDHFEFVLCEVGTGNQLCDAQRGCSTCSKWAASPESVTCIRCTSVFHLSCLDPPLPAKPKAGYAWSCAPCAKAYEEEIEAGLLSMQGGAAGGNGAFASGGASGNSSHAETGGGGGGGSGSAPPVRKAAEGANRATALQYSLGAVVDAAPSPGSGSSSSATGAGSGRGTGGAVVKGNNRAKGKAKALVQTQGNANPHDWRTTNGWPFRYFGMHVNAYAVLDPHDSLYPRASTRLGNKFQCVVPEWDDKNKVQIAPPDPRHYFQPKKSRSSASGGAGGGDKDKGRAKKNAVEVIPRGEDEAVRAIWRPTDKNSDETLDQLFVEVKKLRSYAAAGVDLLNRAVKLLQENEGDVSSTIAALRKIPQAALGHAVWNEGEKKQLMDGAAQWHNDIAEIAKHIPTKKIADVVKKYYISIGHNLQEDELQQPEERTAVASRSRRPTHKKATRANARVDPTDSDDERGSVCDAPTNAAQRRTRFCAICEATDSNKWYHCPDNVSELEVKPVPLVMCETCGFRWRHYGAQYPPTADDLKMVVDKPERKKRAVVAPPEDEPTSTAIRRTAREPKPKEPTPPPPPPPKPVIPKRPCLLCKRFEPKTALYQCDRCTLAGHASCYGVAEGTPTEGWLCDLCEREKQRNRLVLHPRCVLCPSPVPESDKVAPLTALDCLKPTELNNYVHLLCGVWHPELRMSEPAMLSTVEAFALLPTSRAEEECVICKTKGIGVTVGCQDCSKHFHVACAWSAGYRFAFEIEVVKTKKKLRESIITKFKEEEGILSPGIWCPDHHFTHAERKTYDLGARDQAAKLTALQMFVRAYKEPKNPGQPLRYRQAKRFETVVEPVLKPKQPTPPVYERHKPSLLTTLLEESAYFAEYEPEVEEEPAYVSPAVEVHAPPTPPAPVRVTKRKSTSSYARPAAVAAPAPEPHPVPAFMPEEVSESLPEPGPAPVPVTMEDEPAPNEEEEPAAIVPDEPAPLPAKRVRKAKAPPVLIVNSQKQLKKRRMGPHGTPEQSLAPAGADRAARGGLPQLPGQPHDGAHVPFEPSFDTGLPPLPHHDSASHFSGSSVVDDRPAYGSSAGPEPTNGALSGQSSDDAIDTLSAIAAALAGAGAQQQDPLLDPSVAGEGEAAASVQELPEPDFSNRIGTRGARRQSYRAPIDQHALHRAIESVPDSRAASGPPASSSSRARDTGKGVAQRRPSGSVAPSPAPAISSANGPERYTPYPGLPALPPHAIRLPHARLESPSSLDVADAANPIVSYMRAHETAQQDFRFQDTPDDSDATSERLHSPAPSVSSTTAASPNVGLPPLPLRDSPAPSESASAKKRRRYPRGWQNPSDPMICANCGTDKSPLWRRNVLGQYECNACCLYYKAHGHQRPKKVVDRAIGEARVRKRKSEATGEPLEPLSVPSAKRSRPNGAPLPLQHPLGPSPLQQPTFSYDESSASPSTSMPALATGLPPLPYLPPLPSGSSVSAFDGTLSGEIATGYQSPYYDSSETFAVAPHLAYQPGPLGSTSAIEPDGFSPFDLPPPSREDGTEAETAQSDEETALGQDDHRRMLETLAAQALSFGPIDLAPQRGASRASPGSSATVPGQGDEPVLHPAASALQGGDSLERYHPSPPPSASAMPLQPLPFAFASETASN